MALAVFPVNLSDLKRLMCSFTSLTVGRTYWTWLAWTVDVDVSNLSMRVKSFLSSFRSSSHSQLSLSMTLFFFLPPFLISFFSENWVYSSWTTFLRRRTRLHHSPPSHHHLGHCYWQGQHWQVTQAQVCWPFLLSGIKGKIITRERS